ncbi:hypothetical protein B0H17DRAFT_99972 [Mycena rosella]|uniref:Uncharacterized protein n=1 Tax=Mycena rosella TaxID=1033263 RepID=A0AAD7D4W7_MYCRO|nr:hypothetical protein B0H17DRAFT_99972 [Mycena rosella]
MVTRGGSRVSRTPRWRVRASTTATSRALRTPSRTPRTQSPTPRISRRPHSHMRTDTQTRPPPPPPQAVAHAAKKSARRRIPSRRLHHYPGHASRSGARPPPPSRVPAPLTRSSTVRPASLTQRARWTSRTTGSTPSRRRHLRLRRAARSRRPRRRRRARAGGRRRSPFQRALPFRVGQGGTATPAPQERQRNVTMSSHTAGTGGGQRMHTARAQDGGRTQSDGVCGILTEGS